MLSEEEKVKIKEEEIFRIEVKNSLENPPKKNKASTLINSAFGIWFLSTIVIGLFTFFFNEYNINQKESKERNTKIKQLDLEIESRISQFWVHLYPVVNHEDTTLPLKQGVSFDTVKVFWEVFKNSPSSNPKLAYSIFKDYESRTTISLMVELSRLLKDKYQIETEFADEVVNRDTSKPIVLRPLAKKEVNPNTQISNIEKAIVFISTDGIFDYTDKPTSIKRIWENFSGNIINNRWYMLFAYTDCLFC